MKILHVYKTYKPNTLGGVEEFIDTIVNSSQENIYGTLSLGNQNSINYYKNTLSFVFKENFSVRSCPFSISSILNYHHIVKNYDLIHYHYPWPFMDLMHLILFNKKPYVITYHSKIVRQKFLKLLYFPIEYFFIKRAKAIIFSSKNYLKLFKSMHYSCEGIEKVIPFGTTLSSSKEKNIKPFDKYFIFIGQHRNYKGINFLIDAAKQLPNINFLIVGNGEFLNRNIEKCRRLQLKNIKFITQCNDDEKNFYLENSLCLVLPSISQAEAFGIVLIEAMSKKIPLITTNIGTGTTFVNQHMKTGLVVKKMDSSQLIDAINLIYKNNKLRKYFAKNAYNRYLKIFTTEKMVTKYEQMYREIKRNIM